MTPERSERLRQLFAEALGLPVAERTAFLSRNCGSDRELLDEIDSLLSQSSDTATTIQGLRLKESPGAGATSGIGEPTEPAHTEDDQFGPYTIVRLIGEGGMGTVYLVEQTRPIRRQVALKVVKLGMDTRQVIARFESERQALALMEHPHIAQIYDAGTSEKGRPYFAMEYVPGVAITQYCDQHLLDTRERLKMFVTVCEALQHAHQKGVIHRDIKPTNILVFEQDGKPFPKVIDFGIAKATDQRAAEQSAFTQMGSLVGTPEYMSPEQANLTNPNVDTATDVYSLGVLLYELLAGALPFEGKSLRQAGLAELLRIIREEVPPTPSDRITQLGETATEVARCRRTNLPTLRRRLAGELNWIVMKALEKDRSRRYASMSEFSADIERHLRNQPVLAGPPGRGYIIRKFIRRNRGPVVAGIAILACLLFGLTTSTIMFVGAESARREAERRGYVANLVSADLHLRSNEVAEARRRLLACPRALRGWEWQHLFLKSDFSIATLYTLDDSDDERFPASFAFSADGSRIFSNTEHTLYSWDAATFLPAGRWSDFGSIVAVASQATRILAKTYTCCGASETDHTLRIFDPFSHRLIVTFSRHKRRVTAAAFTFDGGRLLTGDADGNLFLWDSRTGRLLADPIPGSPLGKPMVVAIAFSNDGKRIAVAYSDETVRCWDEALHEVSHPVIHQMEWRSPLSARSRPRLERSDTILAFSPDGRELASASGGSMRLWDAKSGQMQLNVGDFNRPLNSLAFTPDASRILIGTADGLVEVRDTHSGKAIATLVGHEAAVQGIGVDPNGHILTAGGQKIRVWNPSSFGGVMTLHLTDRKSGSVALSPNGRLLASTEGDSVRLWDTSSGKSVSAMKTGGRVDAIAFSPDSAYLASVSTSFEYTSYLCTISIREIVSTRVLKSMKVDGLVWNIAFSPDGRSLAYSSADKSEGPAVRFWDVTTGRPQSKVISALAVGVLAYSQDGLHIVTGFGQHIELWRAASNKRLVLVVPPVLSRARDGLDVVFSRDGRRIAAFERFDMSLVIWDAKSGKQLMLLKGPNVPISSSSPIGVLRPNPSPSVAFHPDGRRLFAACGNVVQTWDASSGEPLLLLRGNDQQIKGVVLTADGSRLASFSADGIVRIWDTRSTYNPEADTLVQALFQKLNFASDVTESLRTDASIEDSLRGAALLLVQEQEDHDPVGHIRASWEAAKAPGARRDALASALRHAQVACGLAPWNWEVFNAQGAVQYRLGAYREALSSLLHAAEVRVRPSIANLAFQALTYHGLGETGKARSALAEANQLLMRSDTMMEPELVALVQEAGSVIEGAHK